MDISTVKAKLKNNKYGTLAEVIADLQLIWDNCSTYNDSDSVKSRQIVTRYAKIMERCMQTYVNDHALLQVKEESEDLKTRTARPMQQWSAANQAADDVKPEAISYQEKVELTDKVRRVSPELLEHIVKLVQEESAGAAEQLDSHKLLIRVDRLSRRTYDTIHG